MLKYANCIPLEISNSMAGGVGQNSDGIRPPRDKVLFIDASICKEAALHAATGMHYRQPVSI